MRLRLKIFPLLLLLLCIAGGSHAQGSFSATLEPAVIGRDETTELKLLVENAQQAQLLSAPVLQNFTIISGPNQESGMESINGKVRRYVGYSYILKPKTTGNFVVGSAVANVDGKTLRTKPLHLKVTNAATGSAPSSNPFAGLSPFDEPAAPSSYSDFILKKGEKIEDKIKKNIFIKVEADKTSCYVGEPIVVTYKLYTRLKSESSVIKSPAFNGFSVVDLVPPTGENYTVEKLDGRLYNVYLLRKAQLYPLQAGADTLEVASVENKVNFVKAEYLNGSNSDDILNGFLRPSLPAEAMQTEKVTLQSKPVAIVVKALPRNDSLSSFHGAVGDFSIHATVDKTVFTTSDAGRLQVTVTGAGNLTLLTPPDVKWPAGIEVFEAAAKENINRLSVPVSGTKVYSYPFTVDSPGHYVLPPVVFSYFDLESQRYKTVQTDPVELNITKGNGRKALAPKQDQGSARERFSDTIFNNRWMIIVPVALLILIGLFLWLKNDNKQQEKIVVNKPAADKKTTEEQTLQPAAAAHPFQHAEKLLQEEDARLFYRSLSKELQLFLISKLGLEQHASKRNIVDALTNSSVGFSDTLQIKQLMDDIEMQLYTPFADTNLQQYYDRALAAEEMMNTV